MLMISEFIFQIKKISNPSNLLERHSLFFFYGAMCGGDRGSHPTVKDSPKPVPGVPVSVDMVLDYPKSKSGEGTGR